jgi:hypothetical protein
MSVSERPIEADTRQQLEGELSDERSSTEPENSRPKKKKLSKSEAVDDVSSQRDQVFNEPPGPTCNQLDDVTCNNNHVEPAIAPSIFLSSTLFLRSNDGN